MRQQAQGERCAGGIPDPVVVGRQHPEAVAARGEIGVKGRAPGPGFDPVAVKALQLVAVLHLLRRHKAEARVLKFQPAGAWLDGQLLISATNIQAAHLIVHQHLFDAPQEAARGFPARARDR